MTRRVPLTAAALIIGLTASACVPTHQASCVSRPDRSVRMTNLNEPDPNGQTTWLGDGKGSYRSTSYDEPRPTIYRSNGVVSLPSGDTTYLYSNGTTGQKVGDGLELRERFRGDKRSVLIRSPAFADD